MILFIALPEAEDKIDPGCSRWNCSRGGVRCAAAIRSSAMDSGANRRTTSDHEWIWVRRGICRPCSKTFTILPDWLAPSGHYSLRCRQQACESIAAGNSAEQAVPHCQDPSRLPDPSTVRRWAQRRLLSVWCWVKAGARNERLFAGTHHPCLGLGALCRILPMEARSP